MKTAFVPKSELKLGMRTVLGTITALEFSKSGKTLEITVRKEDGKTFTDRVTALGTMAVFTEES